ncbi:MAG: hypothetical protein FH748_02895 [Balneolaceae bacterium]|nr:hypothetical protein [Balneolaceae bacterium]
MENKEITFAEADQIATKLRNRNSFWVLLWGSLRCSKLENPPKVIKDNPVDKGSTEGVDTKKDGDHTHEEIDHRDEGEEEESRFCGPDGTQWFIRELGLWRTFAAGVNRLAKTWGRAAYRARPWSELFMPQRIYTKSYQYAVLAIVARQLTYSPTTTFVSAAGLCPSNCANTITICSGCIDRSELGNFLYGVIARYMQMTWLQTWLGGIAGNRGRRTASDAAAIELGYDFIDQGQRSNALCNFFNANAAEWNNMQQDGHGCPPCNQSVIPVNAPHVTLPALGGLAANRPINITLPPRVVGQP